MIVVNVERKEPELIVIYQDEYLYAIHKPAGIGFHTTDDALGIVQLTQQYFNDTRLFPVHRLDKMTSGLMIFARNSQVNAALSRQLADKQIEKYYLALSSRKPNKKQGGIIGDMQKGRRGSYLLLREKNNPAVTRFFAKSMTDEVFGRRWLFALKPETGKTHQLRVALKSVGSAILGDPRYGQDIADRGYLHAYKMRFNLYDKPYELIDVNFEGAQFKLQDANLQLEYADFLNPEQLNWPKGAFKLPKAN